MTEIAPYLDALIDTDPKESRFIPDNLTPRLSLEPNIFYRHDNTTIEVRTVEGCKNTIVDTFTTKEFHKRTGIYAEILAAANLILNEQYYLAIIIRDKLSTGSYIVLWNFTLSEWEFHQLSTSIQGSITATGVSVNAFPIPSEASDAASRKAHHLMVLGTETSELHFIDIAMMDQKFAIISQMTDFTGSELGVHSIYILSSSMADQHAMDPKVYVGAAGVLKVFKYSLKDDKQFIQTSHTFSDLLPTQDPVTHINCFRLQDQQKTIIIVGQSPNRQPTSSSDNSAKISVFQTLANGDRSVLETWSAPTTEQKKLKGSELLTLRTVFPTESNSSYYILASFSTHSGSNNNTQILAIEFDRTSFKEVYTYDATRFCYGAPVQDIYLVRGDAQILLLLSKKLVRFNALFNVNQKLEQPIDYQTSTAFGPVEDAFQFSNSQVKTWYNSQEIAAIHSQRKKMHGVLFFDKALTFAKINASAYPPSSSKKLKNLVADLHHCDLDTLRKHSLIYYLLLDCKNASHTRYARRFSIPLGVQKLMDAYWFLDHGQYEDGVRLLSDPGVEVDWTDKIVQTLYDLASPRLALQYITTTKHQLNTTDDIILRMKLLCNCSREGAFLFQREISAGRSDNLQETLMQIYLDNMFTEQYDQDDLETTVMRLRLNSREAQIFVAYLKKSLHPASKECLMRYVAARGRKSTAQENALGQSSANGPQISTFSDVAVAQTSRNVANYMDHTLISPSSDLANGMQVYEEASATSPFSTVGSEALSSRNEENGAQLGKVLFISALAALSRKRKATDVDGDIELIG